jgi:hypothetical protein
MAAGLAAGLALGGAGISYAASSSSTTTPPKTNTPATPAPGAPFKAGHGPRPFGPGPFGFGLGLGGLRGQVLHGTATVQTGTAMYKTVAFQIGTVGSGKSSTSLPVSSADKYAMTYVVTSATVVNAQRDGISDVAVGDQVEVTATVSGNTQTAVSVVDLTKLKSSRHAFGFGPPAGMPGGPAGSAGSARTAAVAGAF